MCAGLSKYTFSRTSSISKGRGPAIIFIHGVGLDKTMWSRQVESFEKSFQVIVYDMLGHGVSPHPPGSRSLEEFVLQLYHLIIKYHLKKTILVGFSMGGLVAREFAIRYPTMVSELVLLNTVFNRNESQQKAVMARYVKTRQEGILSQVDTSIERWFSKNFQNDNYDIIDVVKRRLKQNDRLGYLEAYKVFSMREIKNGPLPIKCPTLIVTGQFDAGSTPEMAIKLGDAIKFSNVEVLEGILHMSPIEGSEKFNKMLFGFLMKSYNVQLIDCL